MKDRIATALGVVAVLGVVVVLTRAFPSLNAVEVEYLVVGGLIVLGALWYAMTIAVALIRRSVVARRAGRNPRLTRGR